MSRVSVTDGTLVGSPVVARKRRRCDGHLAEPHMIDVGDLQVWTALPPGHPDIGNLGWWHAGYCVECWPSSIEVPQ